MSVAIVEWRVVNACVEARKEANAERQATVKVEERRGMRVFGKYDPRYGTHAGTVLSTKYFKIDTVQSNIR
jgi:hypothetical protein